MRASCKKMSGKIQTGGRGPGMIHIRENRVCDHACGLSRRSRSTRTLFVKRTTKSKVRLIWDRRGWSPAVAIEGTQGGIAGEVGTGEVEHSLLIHGADLAVRGSRA